MAVIRLLGAALVAVSGALLGLLRSREIKGRLAKLERLLTVLERMRTEVCLLQTPLPRLLKALQTEQPELFPGDRPGEGEGGFEREWAGGVAAMELCPSERTLMEELGEALMRGEDPTRTFDSVRARLEELKAKVGAEAERVCGTAPTLGLCAGALLALVLL